jgi:hypothetical protein
MIVEIDHECDIRGAPRMAAFLIDEKNGRGAAIDNACSIGACQLRNCKKRRRIVVDLFFCVSLLFFAVAHITWLSRRSIRDACVRKYRYLRDRRWWPRSFLLWQLIEKQTERVSAQTGSTCFFDRLLGVEFGPSTVLSVPWPVWPPLRRRKGCDRDADLVAHEREALCFGSPCA